MVKVEKIVPGGFGLGTLLSGKKVFFLNALPGEEVIEYEVTKTKSHFVEAIAKQIEHSSPYRVIPRDECFISTSPWQIMAYGYELEVKQELVKEVFREHHIDIETPRIITDNQEYNYRNKMEYSLFWDNGSSKIMLAFHQRGSHRKIPITNSSIERPEIFTAAQEIITQLNTRHEEARKYQSLLLRCNQKGEVSGGLFENHHPHPKFKNLTDTLLDQNYSYSPNGFFQINLPVYELALHEIKQHVTTDKVLDLYAGVGTIGLSVARDKNLTLVECNKSAYTELERNVNSVLESGTSVNRGLIGGTAEIEGACPVTTGASDPSRDNTSSDSRILPIFTKSEEALDYICHDQTVILDPPRAGCDKKLIEKLNETKPTTIIYLSCNPATQARDIKQLLGNYHIKHITTYNFFPHTPHIENLVILSL